MPIPKITGQVTSLNYLSFDGTNENFTMVQGNTNITPKLSASLGIGDYWTHSANKNTHKPAFEAKLKYNINNNLNAQARFREIGGTEQYRVAFGGSCKFDKHQSIYAAVHTTAKDSDKWSFNAGGWIGYTYKFNNGIAISGELQQNIPLNKTAPSFGRTVSNFDDSNKMFNVIVSVPLK